MKKHITLLMLAVACSTAFCQGLFTNIYLPGNWPATNWWEQTPYPTTVAASNAWYAVNVNFQRASNAIAVLQLSESNAVALTVSLPTITSNMAALQVSMAQLDSNFTGIVGSNGTLFSGTNTWTGTNNYQAGKLTIGGVPVEVGLINLTNTTIVSATSTTWGLGAGLMCFDSGYVYVSVGTNAWKRASLSTW